MYEFIKAVFTEYSAFKDLSKSSDFTLIFEKRSKILGFYKTLLAKLRLEDEYNYKKVLRLTSENF